MIHHLRIRQLALIEDVSLDFGEGFIAVTGETGAGKSILLGALSLLSGNRMDKTIIRQQAAGCEVEAVIRLDDSGAADALLEGLGLPACEGDELLLFRGLYREKAARVRINGQLATVANLQELSRIWIDFHGPGEPQKLFDEDWQLHLLDLFAGQRDALREYRRGLRDYRDLVRSRDELRQREFLSPNEQEFWRSQLEELEQLDLSPGAIQALERDYARLSQHDAVASKAEALREVLWGDKGCATRLARMLSTARDLAAMDASLVPLADRWESLVIECQDLGESYGDLLGEIRFDSGQSERIRDRMEVWMRIQRKYGKSQDQVAARKSEIEAKLAGRGEVETRIEELTTRITQCGQVLGDQAETIRQTRVKAAKQLQSEATAMLGSLGFRHARLMIDIHREPELGENGNSGCRIMFAPNAGQELLPLNKIASSGELARVMLALKAVLARVDATPVLVFDEVDANVGGEIAGQVGLELARLGERHQVFCITHLPQVAVTARSHYSVEKEMDADRTAVHIRRLDGSDTGRLEEIARMLGDRSSEAALSHARSLLAGRT